MNPKFVARTVLAALVVAAFVAMPIHAGAQSPRGGIGGKIVDGAGQPVADAEVVLENKEVALRYVTKSNGKGEWAQGGMPAGNRMDILVKKGTLSGGIKGVPVRQGSIMEIPPIVISAATPSTSAADAAKAAEAKVRDAALAKIALEVNAALAANDFDLAIAKYNEANATVPNCAQCYLRIGELYVKKNQLDDAEKAFLKAVEFDDQSPEAYSALTNLYNQQKKYAEAAKMNAKLNSLGTSSGGGGDAAAEFSAGAISVNLQMAAEREGKADEAKAKMAEAQAHFEKAIQLKPDMAEAHYELGMLFVKQNEIPEAKKALAEYVKLAPNGPNAEMAKAIATMP